MLVRIVSFMEATSLPKVSTGIKIFSVILDRSHENIYFYILQFSVPFDCACSSNLGIHLMVSTKRIIKRKESYPCSYCRCGRGKPQTGLPSEISPRIHWLLLWFWGTRPEDSIKPGCSRTRDRYNNHVWLDIAGQWKNHVLQYTGIGHGSE